MSSRFENIKSISAKKIILLVILAVLVVAAFLIVGKDSVHSESVDFTVLPEAEIPQDIQNSVIPQYRDLERALACIVDDKVYVIVTRGEKPTSGFDVNIDRMELAENDAGESVLAVYADFTDPEPGASLSQILTYPLQVAETVLTELPDKIELKVQYQ